MNFSFKINNFMGLSFDQLKPKKISEKQYIYSDIRLDITETSSTINGKRDIIADYDHDAIKNSIKTLFSTSPGENLLVPNYGCSLKRHLFEQITPINANSIGNSIKDSIKKYETRVVLTKLNIYPDVENKEYLIQMFLRYPDFSQNSFTINGQLSQSNFSIQ